jgi:hypothetical protein
MFAFAKPFQTRSLEIAPFEFESLAPASAPAAPPAGDSLTLAELRAALYPHAGLPLVFEYGGVPVKPGYHVTEVKSGWFAALDCGANPENWREAFIQLWDVDEGKSRAHMNAGKFLSIIGNVLTEIDLDQDTRLTFEVSDGVRPIELYRALGVEPGTDAVRVTLGNVPASCKPRDRWLRGSGDAKSCCGPDARAKGVCA